MRFFFIFEKSAYAQSLGLNVAAWVAFLLHMILPLLMLFALMAAALVWLLVLEIVTRIAYLALLGGLKKVQYKQLMAQKPELAMEAAVKGMLPKNSLGAKAFTRLKVYAGETHVHEAQKPVAVEF